jgi:hypothetical protein
MAPLQLSVCSFYVSLPLCFKDPITAMAVILYQNGGMDAGLLHSFAFTALLVDKIKSELDSGPTRSEAGSKIFDPGCAGEDVFA